MNGDTKEERLEEFLELVEGNPVPLSARLDSLDESIANNQRNIAGMQKDIEWLIRGLEQIDKKLWMIFGAMLSSIAIFLSLLLYLIL